MRSVSRALLAGGLGLAAAFLAACGGSSGLLSPNQASTFNGLLNQASTDVTNGNCGSALNAIGTFRTQVANLPGTVDPTLVFDLSRGADRVNALVKQQCGSTVGTGTNTGTTTPTTTTHEQTTSTSTSTSPTTTTTTTTPSTTTTTPTTPTTPATTPSTPGTTSTGAPGGGAPTGGGGDNGLGTTGTTGN